MPDSLHDISIQAKPEQVYQAWTTEEGQTSWWTRKCKMADEADGVNVFFFDNGNVEFHFKIEEQVPGKKIRWTGVAAEKMPEEWVGTRIEVDLEPNEQGGTRYRFGHKNWKSADGAYAMCNTTWGELTYRLRDYCEGKGRGPFFPG